MMNKDVVGPTIPEWREGWGRRTQRLVKRRMSHECRSMFLPLTQDT